MNTDGLLEEIVKDSEILTFVNQKLKTKNGNKDKEDENSDSYDELPTTDTRDQRLMNLKAKTRVTSPKNNTFDDFRTKLRRMQTKLNEDRVFSGSYSPNKQFSMRGPGSMSPNFLKLKTMNTGKSKPRRKRLMSDDSPEHRSKLILNNTITLN